MDLEIAKELTLGLLRNTAFTTNLNGTEGVEKGRFLNNYEEGFSYFLNDESGGYSIEIPEKTRHTLLLLRPNEREFLIGVFMGVLYDLDDMTLAEKTRVDIPHFDRHLYVKRETLGELCTGEDLFCAFGVAI